jgi:acyl transferase domain-containing protein
LIRGSAINQDGTSNGITAPNGLAQQAVIRQACRNAGVDPAQIGYIEAHGTGTRVGDPIEINALKNVLLENRPAGTVCRIGAVKTNIGHLEAAAGIAGLIKTVLVLRHREIPANLHLKELNPFVSLKNTPLDIPRRLAPWESGGAPRLAGVSGFSFGGTNCHVILEEAPPVPPRPAGASEPAHVLLPLSAKNGPALRDLAAAYVARLDAAAATDLTDICFGAGYGRAHFPHRLAITGTSASELADRLRGWLDERHGEGVTHRVTARHAAPEIVFLFTGQGSHYRGMGRGLCAAFPRFRRTIERSDAILRAAQWPWSLRQIFDADDAPSLDDAAVAQSVLFALGHALADLWQSWGVAPKAVIGHSLGEYIALASRACSVLKTGLPWARSAGD